MTIHKSEIINALAKVNPIIFNKLQLIINDSILQVSQDGRVIVNGIVSAVKKLSFYHDIDDSEFKDDEIVLNSDDIYEILHAKGFKYRYNKKLICSKSVLLINIVFVVIF